MNKRQVQHTIDTGFSNLEFTPDRKREVLSIAKGEKVVKKKISAALVMALILLAIIGTALAVGGISNALLGQIARVQKEYGLFQEWSIEEKVNLVHILIESGEIEEDTNTDKLLNNNLSEHKTNDLVADILGRWLGPNARVDLLTLHTIIEKAWGTMDTWSLEQKAWLTQTEIDMGIFSGTESFMHVLPQEQDIPLEEAIHIAKEAITQARRLSSSALDNHMVLADLVVRQNVPEDHMWQIFFVAPEVEGGRREGISYDPVLVSAQTGELIEIPEFGIYYPRQVP